MAYITTNKKVSLSQLDRELGGFGLSSREETLPDNTKQLLIVTAEGSPVTDAQLKAAVAAHVADFSFGKSDNAKAIEALSKKPVLTPQDQSDAIKLLLERAASAGIPTP